jgi:hypothetical protein
VARQSRERSPGGGVGVDSAPLHDARAGAAASVGLTGTEPCSLSSAEPPPGSERTRRSPIFAAPALVLTAAFATLEGYRWLHLVPAGSIRTATVLFVAGAFPVTLWLTRRIDCPLANPVRRVARVLAALVLGLGTVTLSSLGRLMFPVLGVSSLALAAALVALAVLSEADTRRTGPY